MMTVTEEGIDYSNEKQEQQQHLESRQERRKQQHSQRKKKSNEKHHQQRHSSDDGQANQRRRRQQRNNGSRQKQKPRKRYYPWRQYIPKGAVDPITLEPLVSLQYPPFAISNESPYYHPIKTWWPMLEEIVDEKENENFIDKQRNQEQQQQQQRMIEQWGSSVKNVTQMLSISSSSSASSGITTTSITSNAKLTTATTDLNQNLKHYHLYDGKALALYMISQYQFIDPLNRRDLSRDELVNLDMYLKRYDLMKEFPSSYTSVTEVYDSRGVTISTAGSVANTESGRIQLLQQTSQSILESLFDMSSNSAARSRRRNHDRRHQIRNQQSGTNLEDIRYNQQHRPGDLPQQQQPQLQLQLPSSPIHSEVDGDRSAPGRNAAGGDHNNNYYYYECEDGGWTIIDDDENPGLRGDGSSGDTTTTSPTSESSLDEEYSSSEEDQQHEGSAPRPIRNPTSSFPLYSASHIIQRHGQGGVQVGSTSSRSNGMNTNNFPSLSNHSKKHSASSSFSWRSRPRIVSPLRTATLAASRRQRQPMVRLGPVTSRPTMSMAQLVQQRAFG